MDLWVREARLFKYGSGTGTNFSSLRGEGEPLSGGGKSLGPDELPQDRRPGRRRHQVRRHHAPRRQDGSVDLDHPDIEEFVYWKVVEEQKVAALVAGSQLLERHVNAILAACHDPA